MPASRLSNRSEACAASPTVAADGTLLHGLPFGLIAFDRALHVVLSNTLADAWFPDAARDLCERMNASLKSDGANWRAEIASALDRNGVCDFGAHALREPVQSVQAVDLILIPHEGDRETAGWLIVLPSPGGVAEQRPATTQRLAAVGKLAAQVAHELNNPLDGVLRYLNLATRVVEGDLDSAKGYLDAAQTGVSRMISIVNQLLTFARQADSPATETTFAEMLEEAVQSVSDRARTTGVTMICHYDDTPTAAPDPNLYHVFRNLIGNAMDAMPKGGRLTVQSTVKQNEIVLTFEDTGPGLPEDGDAVFKPFYTTKSADRGTGLGLAISREIVTRIGGAISAENAKTGGALFTVRVPVQTKPAGAEERSGS